MKFFQNVLDKFWDYNKKIIQKSVHDTKSSEKIQFKELINKNCKLNIIENNELPKIILKKRRRCADPLESEEKIATAYKKRSGNIKETIFYHKMQMDESEISCPVCMDLIISSAITICGHTFCEKCLCEALILSQGCPICRYSIRNSEITFSKSLNNFIIFYADKIANVETSKSFTERVKEYEIWKKSVRLESLCQENDMIDVRDSEYIWCVGIILKTIKRKNNEIVYLIHYKGWSNIFDEYISSNSSRLANFGAYTKRQDIPRYIINENSDSNVNGYVTQGSSHPSNNNFILINDSIDEGNMQEISEIRPLENISREAFNSHMVHFIYYTVNDWNEYRNRNNENLSILSRDENEINENNDNLDENDSNQNENENENEEAEAE